MRLVDETKKCRIIGRIGKLRKEAIVSLCDVESLHFPRGIEGKYDKHH
jgi:hypothetical protein